MRQTIILIGPLRAGKSTVAAALSTQTGLPAVALDDLRWNYYREIGYDETLANEIRAKAGFVALVYYWKQFDPYAVERVLADHPQSIIHFGAGHSVYDSAEQLARVQAALAPYTNVFLLLPSPDPDESIRILNERTADLTGTFAQGFNWNAYFVRHPANAQLARFTVYTAGRTPQETAAEIMRLAAL